MAPSGRLALLTPFAFPSVRGNAVTVARIARGLAEQGVDARVWDLSVTSEATIATGVEAYRPALIHAFHAFRSGPLALRLARRTAAALVVTLTGTDVNHDLFDPDRAPVVRRVLEEATLLSVFHPSIGERIARAVPDLGSRLVTVPQAVSFEKVEPFDLQSRWALPSPRVLFLVPAGVRGVKNPRRPLGVLERLAASYPELRLLYCGPLLDPVEGDALLRALEGRSWARHIGTLPHTQMASLLMQTDVVLNCSISEGGMANSVMEALSLGRAVLASDIEGNRSLVQHGVTGLLFGDDAELEAGAEALIRDPGLRARLGRAGRGLVEARYPPVREIEGYLDVYQRATPGVARSVPAP
jgi:glycosyltransferase involved in cell wall biosynthesis